MPTRLSLLALLGVFLGSHPTLATPEELLPSYHVEATFDAEGRRLLGAMTLTVPDRLVSEGREIRLDLAAGGRDDGVERLTLGPVQASRPAEVVREDGILVVTLEEPVPAGEKVSLSADFESRVWEELVEAIGYPAFWGDRPGRLWYPDVFTPDGSRVRFRDFDVTLTYPDDHAVLTSGREIESAAVSDGMRRSRYTAEGIEGFAVNLAPGFELYEVPAGDVTVVAMVPPDDREAFRKAAHLAAAAVAWYRKLYGFFPVDQIGLAPGERHPIGGCPLPRVFLIHRGFIDDDFLQWITAHELGHYYWGLHVLAEGPDRLDWLNLANGIWADQLYLARLNDRPLAEQWRGRGQGDPFTDYFIALAGNYDQTVGITEAEFRRFPYDYNSYIHHSKAAVGLYLLSLRMGVEELLDVQREVLRAFGRRPFGLEDFLERLESHGAPYARDLLTAWMKDGARVEYAAWNVASTPSPDGWDHRVTVRRTGTIPTDLEVELVMGDGTVLRRTLGVSGFEKERRQVLAVQHDARLLEVRLDPNGVLPMVNGTHPRIRRAALQALDSVHQDGLFFDLVPAYLEQTPEDEDMRFRVGRRLVMAGRLGDACEALRFSVEAAGEPCETYRRCEATLLLAETLARLDRAEEARELLTRVREGVGPRRLAWRWQQVEALVSGAKCGRRVRPAARPAPKSSPSVAPSAARVRRPTSVSPTSGAKASNRTCELGNPRTTDRRLCAPRRKHPRRAGRSRPSARGRSSTPTSTRTPVAASAGRPPPRPSPPLRTRNPRRQRYPTDRTAPPSGAAGRSSSAASTKSTPSCVLAAEPRCG
jgi:hypothetical protein